MKSFPHQLSYTGCNTTNITGARLLGALFLTCSPRVGLMHAVYLRYIGYITCNVSNIGEARLLRLRRRRWRLSNKNNVIVVGYFNNCRLRCWRFIRPVRRSMVRAAVDRHVVSNAPHAIEAVAVTFAVYIQKLLSAKADATRAYSFAINTIWLSGGRKLFARKMSGHISFMGIVHFKL